jgi:arylsulfatase B
VYTEIVDGYAIRNATYKLIKYDNGDEELFNLVQDPYENRNLIGTTLSAEATNEKANLISEAIAIRN